MSLTSVTRHALSTADFDQVGSSAQASSIDYSNIAVDNSTYTNWTLSTSAVTKAGITKLGTREGHDVEDNQIASGHEGNILTANFAEAAGSKRPKLVVNHSAGGGGGTPGALQSISYTYDTVGNITQIVNSSGNAASSTTTYTYDGLYRLTHASTTFPATGQTGYSRRYTYNAVGNIITASTTSSVSTYVYSGNEGGNYANPHAVVDRASTTITYDTRGNVTNDGTYTYTWDHNSRLTQAYRSAATSTTYGYDHTGQRIALREGTATTTYSNRFYNKNATTTTATTTKHIFANGMLVATIDGNGSATSTHYIHTDHLTGSNVITTAVGAQEQVLAYLPFGELYVNSRASSFDEQRKFTGHEQDGQTDLTYMGARYYPATAARFVSQDPLFWSIPFSYLVDPQLQNSYSYARNNPLNKFDPSGRKPEFIDKLLKQIDALVKSIAAKLGIGSRSERASSSSLSAGAALLGRRPSDVVMGAEPSSTRAVEGALW